MKTYTCKRDGSHTKTEAIAKKGHDWGEWRDKNGDVEIRVCKNDANHTEERKKEKTGSSSHKSSSDQSSSGSSGGSGNTSGNTSTASEAGNKANVAVPKTGDDNLIELWLILGILGLAGSGGMWILLRKENEERRN